MTRTERTLLTRSLVLGTVITAIVIACDAANLLLPLENWLYDRRARLFQSHAPRPTDAIVHLDVDDPSQEVLGRWPWPRSVLAQITDVVHEAGAKVLAWDVVFPDAESPEGLKAFSDATRRFGAVLLPASFSFPLGASAPPESNAATAMLAGDLALNLEQVNDRLKQVGLHAVSDNEYLESLRAAMARRAAEEMTRGATTVAELRARLLPSLDPSISSSVQLRVLDRAFERLSAVEALKAHARPFEPGLPVLLTADDQIAPLPEIGRAAAWTGFVDYLTSTDGVVRSIPLWIRDGDHIFPQIGFSMALAYLGVDLSSVKIGPSAVTIPVPGRGDIVIPVRTADTRFGPAGTVMDIPYFGAAGADGWKTMYDYPNHLLTPQHVPVTEVWAECETKHRIEHNNRDADDAIVFMLHWLGSDAKAKQYAAHAPDPREWAPRAALVESILADAGPFLDDAKQRKPQDLRPEDEKFIGCCDGLRAVHDQNQQLGRQLDDVRANLRNLLAGKAVIVGSTSTAASDFVATPLAGQVPGVTVHGTIFNDIVTGWLWKRLPAWVTWLLAAFIGLGTTAMVAWLAPWNALAGSILLTLGYLAFDCLYLFDRHRMIVGLAAPVLAAAAVGAGLTIYRFVVAKAERARITRRFRSYVDPAIVDYVVENPQRSLFEGEERELTVVFTDLEGFTSIAETLKGRSVAILNDYFKLMVPIVRRHGGLTNKFLGDGFMFFYGAPQPKADHAAAAVMTVLEMQQCLGPFNQSLVEQGIAPVVMRAGISTGMMIVGDAGSEDFSDYTVLGDAVNLGARMESANKVFGSRVMMNKATADQIDGQFLLRPLGKIQVAGKSEATMAFEAMAMLNRAAPEQIKLAEVTKEVVDCFIRGEFAKCLAALEHLERQFGPSKLSATYRELCVGYITSPPMNFDGQIVLSAK